MDSRARVVGRRLAVVGVLVVQAALLVRGAHADHKEFAFRMFPEASTWRADVVRVTSDGRRIPVEDPWPGGYRWDALVGRRGLAHPEVRRHADAGVANQLAFLRAALSWVAAHTPRDDQTRYLEADVTYWHNADPPRHVVYRSPPRHG